MKKRCVLNLSSSAASYEDFSLGRGQKGCHLPLLSCLVLSSLHRLRSARIGRRNVAALMYATLCQDVSQDEKGYITVWQALEEGYEYDRSAI